MISKSLPFGLCACFFLGSPSHAMTICQVGGVQIIVGQSKDSLVGCVDPVRSVGSVPPSTRGRSEGEKSLPVSVGSSADEVNRSDSRQNAKVDRVLILRHELAQQQAALAALDATSGLSPLERDRRRRDHLANIDSVKRELIRTF